MIATRKTHQIVALICLLSMGTALAASTKPVSFDHCTVGTGAASSGGRTAQEVDARNADADEDYTIKTVEGSEVFLRNATLDQLEALRMNPGRGGVYDPRLNPRTKEFNMGFCHARQEQIRRSSANDQSSCDSGLQVTVDQPMRIGRMLYESLGGIFSSDSVVRRATERRLGDWRLLEERVYALVQRFRTQDPSDDGGVRDGNGDGSGSVSAGPKYRNVVGAIALTNALLALPKLRSDYADANKLMPERPSDMKRGWIRAFDDQVLGAGRIGTSSALAVTALLHAAAAGGRLKNYRNFDPKAIAGVGLAGAALATKVIEFLHGLFTMGKVRVNARERGDYARWLRNANEDELEQLVRTRSGLKTRAWLTALLSLAESGVAYAMVRNLKENDFQRSGDQTNAAFAPVIGFMTLLKSIVAMSTRSKFAGALANGVSKGEKMREYDARARQHQATGRRRRVRRA